MILELLRIHPRGAEGYFYIASPVFIPMANEMRAITDIERLAPWAPILLNMVVYTVILFAIRQHCLNSADRYLRR